ncbi:hypothetical protein [Kutzneria sp. CA-103260]|uniref:hypothetical protein n=1 Tax=Kutzneria sp. CA-103260 TaxID=2802641 RepID=UPI001BA5D10B|nr:hypothetical protein [Kutzneria sp. CA-103260]QUQ69042.1 hypothetical protein JJ691_67960 [Kutzneria sp. CA-103260]
MKHKGITVLVPLALASAAALGLSPAAQAVPPTVQGDTQLVTTDTWGDLQHTIRHPDGSWQRVGLIPGYGHVDYLTSTSLHGEDNVVVEYHTGPSNNPNIQAARLIRHDNGNWDFHASMPQLPVSPEPIAAVAVDDQLNVVSLTPDGPQVATLGPDDQWSGFSTVPLGTHLRSIAAVDHDGALRVVGLSGDGLTVSVIDRTATGWSPVTRTQVDVGEGNIATQLAAVQVGDTLQVGAVVNSTTDSNAIPSIAFATMDKSGAWSAFAGLRALVWGRPSQLSMVATLGNGETQLAYTTTTGDTYHTIRHADGTWQDAGSVQQVAGGEAALGPVTITGY